MRISGLEVTRSTGCSAHTLIDVDRVPLQLSGERDINSLGPETPGI